MPTLPLFVNLVGRRCLVVGGGAVGRRKANTLLAAGAVVRVVCLEVPSLVDVEWHTEPYMADHLADCVLVCAAALPEVNAVVVADALARGLWVNSATEPDAGNVLFPATADVGMVQLAVSTQGASPIVARHLVQTLAASLDDAWPTWVALLAELRPFVRDTITDAGQRRTVLKQLAEPRWLERLQTEDAESVRQAMQNLVRETSRR